MKVKKKSVKRKKHAGKNGEHEDKSFDKVQHARPRSEEFKAKSKKSKPKIDKRSKKHKDFDDDSSEFEEVEQVLGVKDAPLHQDEDDDQMDEDVEYKETRKMVQQQNRKKKKSGGFQSMGLSFPVYKGIMRKGYKVPTPIQRKTVPLILDGKDVVAMARTGSGKTAAFLIPMFEMLKTHSAKSGARALVLSPTRELALQTLKFTKELGKFTGLRSAVILGGDKMEDQFAALHENPDIIIATPGRFMHVLVEMELKLQCVQYVVFDEADRLFEMGFQEQLQEVLKRLPEDRQTLLFSATLPKLLVEFAKAGLHDPTLIRLDVDTKLSDQLKLSFLHCRSEDKVALLLYLLRNVMKPSEQTVVFAATKHHVEYLSMVLCEAGISSSHSYSTLDPTARKINVAKFRNKKTMVLIVTDLAARGIDIPLLDNIINFNFPAKPKLFVHRVGRVARAGRSGVAHSLVGPDEISYVLDLHLFLGRPLKYATMSANYTKDDDGVYGRVPQSVIDDEEENLRLWHQKTDLQNMRRVIANAYKNYSKSRPAPSSESVKRAKEFSDVPMAYHPMFGIYDSKMEEERTQLIESMQSYKPRGTVFEINTSKNRKSQAYLVMKGKREHHGHVIQAHSRKVEERKAKMADIVAKTQGSTQEPTCNIDMQTVFSSVIGPGKPASETADSKKKKKKMCLVDEENFLAYRPKDDRTERGLGVGNSFEKEAAGAMMDLTGDEDRSNRKMQNTRKWDRKRKRFVVDTGMDPKKKKVKTESGAWVSASYKSNIYKDWLEKNKVTGTSEREDNSDEDEEKGRAGQPHSTKKMQVFGGGNRRRFQKGNAREVVHGNQKKFKRGKGELKTKDEILKQRRQKAKTQSFQKFRKTKRDKRKASKGKR